MMTTEVDGGAVPAVGLEAFITHFDRIGRRGGHWATVSVAQSGCRVVSEAGLESDTQGDRVIG